MATAKTFVVSVRDLVGKPGEMRDKQIVTQAPEQYGQAVARVPAGREVSVDLRLESVHEGIFVSGTIHTVADGECVRCLEPVTIPIEAAFEELFAFSPDDSYDYQVVDETIDLDDVVRDQVVLELPFQPVCSEDCPGLDPETGRKRTEGFTPTETTDIDPRWEQLKKLVSDTDTEA